MLGPLFVASAQLIHTLLSLATLLVLVRVVLSWIRPSPPQGVLRSLLVALYALVDPVLYKTRSLLPFLIVGSIDLTPIALILGLQFTDTVLTGTLMRLAVG